MGWFLWLLMAMACEAAEIVAWKVPLTRLADKALETAGVARCKTAPETSPFFGEGDELWDLKEIMPEDGRTKQKLKMEFLVWNASSSRVVAKGNWADICALNDVLRPDGVPRHCRLSASLYQIAADGGQVKVEEKPVAELSTLAKSGQKIEARWELGGKMIKMDGEVCLEDSYPVFDVRLDLSAKVPGQSDINVNTDFIWWCGKILWVARDFDGKNGLDLKVTGTVEMSDGTPVSELVLIQKGAKSEPLGPDRSSMTEEPQRVGEAGWLTCIFTPPWLFREVLSTTSPDNSQEVDPIADSSSNVRVDLPRGASVMPPEFLRPWVRHEVLDAEELGEKIARKFEVNLKDEKYFIGYDPIEERLYFHSANRELVESFRGIFMCLDGDLPDLVITTLEGVGQTRLISRAGRRAKLSRSKEENRETRYLEVEPTIGDSGKVIDMRLAYSGEPSPHQSIHLNSYVSLNAGQPMELISGTAGDEEKVSLKMKAEILGSLRGDKE